MTTHPSGSSVRIGRLTLSLMVSSGVELGTGVASILIPSRVARLLLGSDLSEGGVQIASCFGIALIALGMACWPAKGRAGNSPPRALLVVNTLVAGYLALVGSVHVAGLLLWPAVAFHAGVAVVLLRVDGNWLTTGVPPSISDNSSQPRCLS